MKGLFDPSESQTCVDLRMALFQVRDREKRLNERLR